MGCHEPISPNLSPSIEKYTPLPSQFPSVQGLFENDELNFNNFLKSLPPCSHLYAKDLSSCVLKILLEALRSSSLGVDTLNSEIGIYLKQQGLPAPWVSPTLGKVRSQSVDFDLSDTPYPPDISCGCGLLVHFPESSSLVEFQVGIQNVCAIYSTSFLYRNIFSALALTHYLEESFSTMLPLFVLVRRNDLLA